MKNLRSVRLALAAATALTALPVLAQEAALSPGASTTLEGQFRDPPNSARPRVWWHWMNGNVTKDGIAKDMDWMKRVGIGGLQNFDANLNTPQIVDKRLVYMSPEWKDAFRFAASEADRLGLELAIAASPGWSETGGPWVPPQDGLKKVVWSETDVPGGKRFSGKLAAPPHTTGPYQTIAATEGAMMSDQPRPAMPAPYYADIAVLAVPLNASSGQAAPVATDGTGKAGDAALLSDGDLDSGVELARAANQSPLLELSYPAPRSIRSARVFVPGSRGLYLGSSYAAKLEASSDGREWKKVSDITLSGVPTTVAFAPVTASRFRVVLEPAKGGGPPSGFGGVPGVDVSAMAAIFGASMGGAPKPPKVTEFRLFEEDRVDRAEAKAGFTVAQDYYALNSDVPQGAVAAPAQVIDLTSRLGPDGTLNWTPPKGRWRILRLGYSLLGTMNHPATAEATGLEVDKFDGPAVRRYLEHYIGMYKDAAGSDLVGARGVRAILTDSIEVGAANWTPQLIAQFKRLRGYDPTPWLPSLTGLLIGSRADTDKFLFDFRRTLADLMASEHYGTVATVAHEHGLKVYGESLEDHRPSLGDDIAMRRYADVPMSALWTYRREDGPRLTYIADMKGAASTAHIYGQNLVAAESMTASMSPWAFGPNDLKRIIDLEFVTGVNRPVIHTSVHAPTDDKKPGLSLFIFGQYFNRHESWAEMAKPWVDYISRNSLLLQAGRNFADVAYFYGEEAPVTGVFGDKTATDAPKNYAYDFINADALLNALANEGSDLVTTGGARYRALYLGGSTQRMTLPVLRKLAALAEAGATIIGPKPVLDPSLAGDAPAWSALADRLWSGGATTQVGKGRVIASSNVEAGLRSIALGADFRFSGQPDSEILFLHRQLPDGDSYFLSNRKDRAETGEARFRVTGKAPEFWHADTGIIEPASYRIENGETVVPMVLGADESVHVVFRKPAHAPSLAIKKIAPVPLARIEGPWTVTFEPARGAPAGTTLMQLSPLNEHAEPGIKYFSGTATYTKELTVPSNWRRGQPLWLDLGEMREVAEVRVNGQLAGTAWHAPYRVDVSQVAKPGRNRLEVRVANLWVNRLVGDAQPGAQKVTWTALPTYRADAPLRRSGLIGPVELLGPR